MWLIFLWFHHQDSYKIPSSLHFSSIQQQCKILKDLNSFQFGNPDNQSILIFLLHFHHTSYPKQYNKEHCNRYLNLPDSQLLIQFLISIVLDICHYPYFPFPKNKEHIESPRETSGNKRYPD